MWQITFDNDSKLQGIGSHSFGNAKIESITIPTHVTLIDEYAFECCGNLKALKIQENSELQSIGKNAFYSTSIETVSIPQNLISIGEYAFSSSVKIIDFSLSKMLHKIGTLAFCSMLIESITIP